MFTECLFCAEHFIKVNSDYFSNSATRKVHFFKTTQLSSGRAEFDNLISFISILFLHGCEAAPSTIAVHNTDFKLPKN